MGDYETSLSNTSLPASLKFPYLFLVAHRSFSGDCELCYDEPVEPIIENAYRNPRLFESLELFVNFFHCLPCGDRGEKFCIAVLRHDTYSFEFG